MTIAMQGKRGLIMGVANDRSIAWGIARAMHAAGAELAFSYQGENFAKRVEPLAASVGSDLLLDVDVTDDASLDAAFGALAGRWPTIDFVVHAVAYSDKSELTGRFLNTSRANFKHSLEISAYSLIEVARRAYPMMKDQGGCLLTLTYQGSNKVVPNYNVMGVAKAALESATRYLANGAGWYPRQRDQPRTDENAGRGRDWRRAQDVSPYRAECADARQCDARGYWWHGGLSGVRCGGLHQR